MSNGEPTLPRPLKPGEFFCWQCGTFQKMSEHEEHNKKCPGRRNR